MFQTDTGNKGEMKRRGGNKKRKMTEEKKEENGFRENEG